MALEDKIDELIEALKENTAALGGAESKPAGKPAGKPASKPAGKPAGKKKVTVEEVAEAVGAYMGAGNAKQKKEAIANVERIVEHFGVERISHVEEDQLPEVLKMVKAFENGEDPLEDEGGDEGDGSSLM